MKKVFIVLFFLLINHIILSQNIQQELNIDEIVQLIIDDQVYNPILQKHGIILPTLSADFNPLKKPLLLAFDINVKYNNHILLFNSSKNPFNILKEELTDFSFFDTITIHNNKLNNIVFFDKRYKNNVVFDTNYCLIGYMLLNGFYTNKDKNMVIVDIEIGKLDRERESACQLIYYLKKINNRWTIINCIRGWIT